MKECDDDTAPWKVIATWAWATGWSRQRSDCKTRGSITDYRNVICRAFWNADIEPEQAPSAAAPALLGRSTDSGLAGAVEPLLDRLISLQYRRPDSDQDIHLPRIAELDDAGAVGVPLYEPRQNVLGTHTLVRHYRRSNERDLADEHRQTLRIRTELVPTRCVIAEFRSLTYSEDVS